VVVTELVEALLGLLEVELENVLLGLILFLALLSLVDLVSVHLQFGLELLDLLLELGLFVLELVLVGARRLGREL